MPRSYVASQGLYSYEWSDREQFVCFLSKWFKTYIAP